MFTNFLVPITTFLASLGIGHWFGIEDGGQVATGRALPPLPADPQVIALSNEIDTWMSMSDPSLSNMPDHLRQVVADLNGTAYDYNVQHIHGDLPAPFPGLGSSGDSSFLPESTSTLSPFLNFVSGGGLPSSGGGGTDRIFTLGSSYCTSCKVLAKTVIGYIKIGGPIDIMASFLVKICYIVAYKSLAVCRGLINQDKDRLAYIVKNVDVNAEDVCSLLLGGQDCGTFRPSSWTINLPPRPQKTRTHAAHYHQARQAPAYAQPQSHPPQIVGGRVRQVTQRQENSARSIDAGVVQNQQVHQQGGGHQLTYAEAPDASSESAPSSDKRKQRPSSRPTLKVLHLTDPHYDPDYRVGSNAECDAPLCCNADSGSPSSPAKGAGKWGDYRNCDSPRWLLEHMLHHIATHHQDIDYILCTGDLVPHHIWKITPQENVKVMGEARKLVQSYFPKVPVYGAVGNHESFPRDSFPPPEVPEVWNRFGVQWLYDAVSTQWSHMMRQPAPASSRFGGYYSVLVRPGFRIISINTNYCYRFNWWLLYKSVDPGLVLRWLVEELQAAEERGELVHLIGHIPPLYTDCVMQWAHEFSRVVSRFSHIIRGQFYGHSHLDEFRVHYDVDNPLHPIGIEYITPNNGPFRDLNPSYRIFTIDGDHPETTRDVLDYETWVMNLTHANTYDDPYWYKLYSARHDLQLPSLEPKHWHNLVHRMAHDPWFFAKFHRYQSQDSEAMLSHGCDESCRRATLCGLVEGDRLIPNKCRPEHS
ncbi:sphingomyelin phosphodiesterase-like [Oratosquilla oratoria]|uniref:sphingomyelin phosphodiesterase-like n=1 Tax=Oratosquilla oratoria TaxID=337810 RepID=UPI003F75D3F1